MKDPFEAAYEEQDSPPASPLPLPEEEAPVVEGEDEEGAPGPGHSSWPLIPQLRPTFLTRSQQLAADPSTAANASNAIGGKGKEDEEEEEEENMDVELRKFPSTGDPDKIAKMQAILAQFSPEQMSRYESFRRSGFQKSNMRRLLAAIVGSQKISVPMTIVGSGIAKMFVGELVETGRIVMRERKESGPLRPCHIREAYRRLRREGKVPRKSVPRLFR
ncbi:LOW QUALITY PROTEIN: transcription initiation factor TFIID subunit 11-like [Phalaenopsis equestris]|uniref:LOW QUALITY PROTEIN: transcription initiation factor TFIID subunit 11-like n=1 Tax=Phalaenopsis equestris TaxID=78828 RepID=UPI0009E2F8B7|nr:LOW QUALITY PROTEIN: transcription initiation factor TFIID subunit 11-like [Phalaenopsis equestris]